VKPDFVGPVWDGGSVCPLEPDPDLVLLGLRAALRKGHAVTKPAVAVVLAAVLPEFQRRVLAAAGEGITEVDPEGQAW